MSAEDFTWTPDPAIVAESNLVAFMKRHGIDDYDALMARAEADPDWYWNAVLEENDYRFYKPYDRVLDTSKGAAWAEWCVGGTTNTVLNCLDKWRDTPTYAREAISWEGEDGSRRVLSYAELDAETCRLAGGLRALGLGRGDVVGVYMPMLPEAVAAFLAIIKIGGIALPLFSGFAAEAAATRMNDGGAKGLILADGSLRRGQPIDMKAVADEVAAAVPTLEHVVIYRHLGLDVAWQEGRDHWWSDVVSGQSENTPTEEMGTEEPLLLVFTSGTTGKAKGTVHSHCGFANKVSLDLGLMMDLKPSDRMLWMSDMGWLVGPIIIIGNLVRGSTMVLIEGAPNFPESDRMWRVVADHRVTYLGIAPTVARLFMAYPDEDLARNDLSSLRIFASTGEPWNPDSWLWLFEKVGGGRLPILNYTGGTEIGGGILTTTVIHPMRPCSFTGSIPGHGADIVDQEGNPVAVDEVGELVMRVPSIGLTRGLWQDPERYLDTYWNKIPDLWVHGDWASRDAQGLWYVHGRSDDTINVAGKRTGPAEIESLLLNTGRISEAAVIGVPDDIKGSAIVCVVVAAGEDGSDELRGALSSAVVDGLGNPFRPRQIIFVGDLPKTRNMKIMRRVVRAVYNGQDPGDLASLVNPEAVDGLKAVLEG